MTINFPVRRRQVALWPMAALVVFAMTLSPCVRAEQSPRAPGAKLETAALLAFTEGPVYAEDGSVYFTDIVNNRIMRLKPGSGGGVLSGGPEVFRAPAGRAAGLAFDLQGRLLAAEVNGDGGNRRVTRTEKDGTITVLADHYQGKKLNSPNDLDIDAKGRIYFTDPRYLDRSDVEQDKDAVYRIDPDGTLTRIIDDVERPNGLAVSADQKTLYVVDNNDSNPKGSRKVYAYELKPDGSTGSRRVIHDFGTGRGGDGVCLDAEGNLYVAAGRTAPNLPAEDQSVKGGIYVFSSSGKQIDFISVPVDLVTNVAFGDPDLKTLYLTAGPSLLRIRRTVPGYVLWPVLGQVQGSHP
jgi:gluconolactonase